MTATETAPCAQCDGRAKDREQACAKLGTLTHRQLQIALELARGRSNGEIALNLNIAEKTVRNQLNLIYGPLELSNRVQLARLVWTAGEA